MCGVGIVVVVLKMSAVHINQYYDIIDTIQHTTVLQPLYQSSPVKKWKILLEQSFIAHVLLLMASSTFGLGRKCYSLLSSVTYTTSIL